MSNILADGFRFSRKMAMNKKKAESDFVRLKQGIIHWVEVMIISIPASLTYFSCPLILLEMMKMMNISWKWILGYP